MKKTFLGVFSLLSVLGTTAYAADASFVPASSSLSASLDLNQSSSAPVLSISYKNNGSKGSLAPSLSGTGFSILSNRCLSVSESRSCVVSVIMNARNAGSYSATLSAPNSSPVSLSGSVTAKSVNSAPSFAMTPATQSISFATGEKSKIVHVSIKNTGGVSATPSVSISSNASGLSLILNRCVGGIRPGASCDVAFSASNKVGTNSIAEALGSTAQIVIASSAPVAAATDLISVLPSKSTSLAGYWPLATNANDLIAQDNGTSIGNVTFDGTSARFDGNSFLDMGDSSAFHFTYGSTFSFSFWTKMDDISRVATFIGHGLYGYSLYNQSATGGDTFGYLNFARAGIVNANMPKNNGTYLKQNNTWIHISLVSHVGQDVTVYVNGVSSGIQYFYYGFDFYGNTTLQFGATDVNLIGNMAEVGIYNTGLSDADVSAIYAAQKSKFGF